MGCPYNHNGYCAYTEFDIDRLNWGCRDDFNKCNYKSAAQVRKEEAEEAERKRRAASGQQGSSDNVLAETGGCLAFIGKIIVIVVLIGVAIFFVWRWIRNGLVNLGIFRSEFAVTITDADPSRLSDYMIRFVPYNNDENEFKPSEKSFKKETELVYKVKKGNYEVFWVLEDRASYMASDRARFDGETDYRASFSASLLDDCFVMVECQDAEGAAFEGQVNCSSTQSVTFVELGNGLILVHAAEDPGILELTLSSSGYESAEVSVDFAESSYYHLTVCLEPTP